MSGRPLSIGRLAVFSLGPAALVLVVAAVAVVALKPGPGVALVIVLIALVGSIAVLGFVSSRMVNRAIEREEADKAHRTGTDEDA